MLHFTFQTNAILLFQTSVRWNRILNATDSLLFVKRKDPLLHEFASIMSSLSVGTHISPPSWLKALLQKKQEIISSDIPGRKILVWVLPAMTQFVRIVLFVL